MEQEISQDVRDARNICDHCEFSGTYEEVWQHVKDVHGIEPELKGVVLQVGGEILLIDLIEDEEDDA